MQQIFSSDKIIKVFHGYINDVKLIFKEFECIPLYVLDTNILYRFSDQQNNKNPSNISLAKLIK